MVMPAIQTFMTGIFRTFNMPKRRSARFVDRQMAKTAGAKTKVSVIQSISPGNRVVPFASERFVDLHRSEFH
jgi:hypothetical protein